MAKEKIGEMPCEGQNCKSHARGQVVLVFQNEKGTLSYRCDWCGRAPYAIKGTEQHSDWLKDIKPLMGAMGATHPPEKTPKPAPGVPENGCDELDKQPAKNAGLLL